MNMLEALARVITVVWTPVSVLVALTAGLGLGLIVLGYLSTRPAYATDVAPSAAAWLTIASASLAGIVFYAGQAIATIAESPGDVDRVISRCALWIVYSVGMGLGLYARLRLDRQRRTVHVREVAHAEVDSDASH